MIHNHNTILLILRSSSMRRSVETMVEPTEDSRIDLVYTKQDARYEESIKPPLTVQIPKPVPLIGGTEVYQKDNGTPYWYCKIKKGRDEFMHLYFEDLTENDLLYDTNGNKRDFVTMRQELFKVNVLKALNNKPTEGYRWIPVFEPSINPQYEELQYIAGEDVLVGLNIFQWRNLIKYYSPENASQEASITTYFLLLLRWLKDGLVKLEQLTDDSKEIGHYRDSVNGKRIGLEETGKREFGGLYGFVGNTFKVVSDPESCSKYQIVGGNAREYGNHFPLAKIKTSSCYGISLYPSICLMELIK